MAKWLVVYPVASCKHTARNILAFDLGHRPLKYSDRGRTIYSQRGVTSESGTDQWNDGLCGRIKQVRRDDFVEHWTVQSEAARLRCCIHQQVLKGPLINRLYRSCPGQDELLHRKCELQCQPCSAACGQRETECNTN
jgi:hypothetical protein